MHQKVQKNARVGCFDDLGYRHMHYRGLQFRLFLSNFLHNFFFRFLAKANLRQKKFTPDRGGIKTKNADNVRVFGGGGGGSEIPENADILGFFFPRKFFSSLGSYTILTKIYKNSSISAN